MNPIPLLIFSDTPSAPTGLARICRDLATRIATHMSDVFRVATIGYGGSTSRSLPFYQYSWTFNEEFLIHDLPDVWADFAGKQRGIFLSIQDPSRMIWFARPEACTDVRVKNFLNNPPFEKWGYFPIDATGPNNRLNNVLKECFLGYDRILCYSQWAETIVLNTIGIAEAEQRDLQNLPHGIDSSVFYPRGKKWRNLFGQLSVRKPSSIASDELLVGIVATNQLRKDYGLAFEICAELSKKRRMRIWIHTDAMERHWSLIQLFNDFEFRGDNLVSFELLSDDTMAKLYSSCDVTLGIGNGEGYGYPIFESLACGTPVIHGFYGGAPEHMPDELLVNPVGHRLESHWNSVRNVYDAHQWVERIEAVVGKTYSLPEQLDWNKLWPRWEKWLRKGIGREENLSSSSDNEMGRMERMLGVVATP